MQTTYQDQLNALRAQVYALDIVGSTKRNRPYYRTDKWKDEFVTRSDVKLAYNWVSDHEASQVEHLINRPLEKSLVVVNKHVQDTHLYTELIDPITGVYTALKPDTYVFNNPVIGGLELDPKTGKFHAKKTFPISECISETIEKGVREWKLRYVAGWNCVKNEPVYLDCSYNHPPPQPNRFFVAVNFTKEFEYPVGQHIDFDGAVSSCTSIKSRFVNGDYKTSFPKS